MSEDVYYCLSVLIITMYSFLGLSFSCDFHFLYEKTQNKFTENFCNGILIMDLVFSFHPLVSHQHDFVWLMSTGVQQAHVSCDRGSWPEGGLLCSSRPVDLCQAVRQMKLHSIRLNQGCQGGQLARLPRPQGLSWNCPLIAYVAKMP